MDTRISHKKVLFVVSSLNTGGAQRVVSNIVTHFPDDWHIDILLNSHENIVFPYKGNIISLNLKEPKNRSSCLYQIKVLWKRVWALRKLKQENGYAASISFLNSANVANVLSGAKYCNTIVSTHTTISRSSLRGHQFFQRLLGFFLNKADAHVAVSEGVRNDLITMLKCDPNKIVTTYNGFDLSVIEKKSAAEVAVSLNGVDIVTMGRLTAPKHQWHLIRCVHELKKTHPDIKCLIIGDGPYEDYFRRMIKNGGLEDNVILSGFLENPFPLLKQGKMFVFPSGFEGFGNVVIEAMALGLPCVLTDYRYGAREIVAPKMDIRGELTDHIEMAEYGILTPVCSGNKYRIDDPLEKQELLLCEAIEKMMDERTRERYASQSLKRAADFDINRIVKQWVDVIEGR